MLSEAGSPYSPLFTSGLLSNDLRVPRRGSLPSDSLGGTYQSHSDTSSAFYFTLQARRDPIALRSFLSLDLAESIHTASLRKINTHPAPLLHTSKWLHSQPVRPPSPVRRASGEHLRSIPSPKPVPSSPPPGLPKLTLDLPPVLPPIVSSARLSFVPELHGIIAPAAPITHITPPSPSSTEPPPTASILSITSAERRISREGALASLEGRAEADFMDMSDDEDDERVLLAAAVEDEDVIISVPPPPTKSSRRTRKRKTAAESWFPLASFIDLKEDDTASWNWRNFIEIGGVS